MPKTLVTPRFDAAYEVNWKKRWPEFEQRPATILEFIDTGYLDIAARVREAIKVELVEMFGDEVSGDRLARYAVGELTGAIGIGKQLKIGTPILTPKGWIPIESLSVGDPVIGSNGRTTTVTGVYPQGRKPLYRVTFVDGSWVDAGAEHLWSVTTRWRQTHGSPARVMSTSEIAKSGLRYGDSWKWRIPIVQPVEYEAGEPLSIPAYTLGALLGDGCFTKGTITLAGDDLEVGDRVQVELPDLMVVRQRDGRQWTISRGRQGGVRNGNRLMAVIRRLGLVGLYSHEKFIPESYMRASAQDRLDMIRGLMDTDGCVMGRNGAVFANGSLRLCEQVVELVQSLGGTARLTSFDRGGERSIEYQVKINLGPTCPFWISRKVAKWRPRANQKPTRAIVSIERVDDDEAFCIAVDAPDHLYVTKDFIVTHNTTIASIVDTYMAHYVLCLYNPQDYYSLLPGSRIAFMQMSTSEKQALEVVFGDIKARLLHAAWFVRNYPFDPSFKNQIRFTAKDVWIIPGDSHETTFEGYNILGGILDEADSHIVTATKDYAEIGFDTIKNRIDSRFGDKGFLLVIGQMKSGDGFASRKFEEFSQRDDAYAKRMTIWESFGEDYYRCKLEGPHERNPELPVGQVCDEIHRFPYDTKRKQVITEQLAKVMGSSDTIIWIPDLYKREFITAPEKALKDLAGIPPAVGDPFISLPHKIDEAVERWIVRYGPTSPVSPEGILDKLYAATDSLPRVGHIDIAYSGQGDALGFAMGHVQGVADIEGENKPYIVIDLCYRVRAPAGGEIFLQGVRQFIYNLKEARKFKMKFVSTDGFQGVDTRQQLAARRILTDVISVDKDLVPYYDLRDALYEDRIELPPYMVHLKPGSHELVPILVKEMSELIDAGKKIDHPPLRGSKDVSDAVAAVVFKLMGDRAYRRNVVSFETHRQQRDDRKVAVGAGSMMHHPAFLGGSGVGAPIPPSTWRT